MGVLCSCPQAIISGPQAIISAKEKQVIEINPKIQENKIILNKNINFKSKYKENHLTKDSTLVNYSHNNNSPDQHESNKNFAKNNFTEIEAQNNNSKKKEIKYNRTSNYKTVKKTENENDISHKTTFDKINHQREIINSNKINNIHVIYSPVSLINSKKPKKSDKFLNIINKNGGENGPKNIIRFRAGSFNLVENPIKNILTNKSNNLAKGSPKKNFIANKTIDGTNNQEGKNFKLSFSIKTNTFFSQENQKLLKYYLHKHFMIMEYNEEFITYLMDFINILKYNNKEIIFKKGELANNFYIIKQGVVMLIENGKIYKKLNAGNTFGELSLFQKEINENNDINDSINHDDDTLVRNYTAISYGKTELFSINYSSYNIVLKSFSSKLKTINYNEANDELKEQSREIIENYKFFKYLDNRKKDLIIKTSKIFQFKENGILLSISNFSKKDKRALIEGKPFFRSNQNLIFPLKGELIELSESLSYRKKINKNECSGIIPVLYSKIKNQLYTKTNQEDSKILYIPEEILIEVLGPNYSNVLLKHFFIHHFSQQKILSVFLNIDLNFINDVNNLEENIKKKINETFNTFSIKVYEKGEIIYNHQNNIDNKKIIFPIINNIMIFNSDIKKKEIKEETILIDEIFNDYNQEFNIRCDNSCAVVLEAKWKNIFDHFYNLSKEYEDIIKRFNIYKDMILFRPFYSLTIEQLIDFGLNSEIKEYKPKEIILKNKEKNNIFYLIVRGRVKVKNPETNKTLRVYEEGNCFGEYYILTDSEINYNYISSEYTKCYCIKGNLFYEYLKIESFNDYIKRKMLLEDEDEEMKLKDFYYITYLGKGTFGYVCLVHNELSFYAIKAVNRDAAEKGKNGIKNLVNEKKCMIAIDHPFIVNFVKTMKNKKWVFILEEYIKGKNFDDYLINRRKYKNNKELIFYGGCIFHMLKYLTKRRICHRDIKPRNMMIGSDGYLKLLDFGCAKKIKFFSKTVVGTPNYMSPEVLKGLEYSFSCDYWSAGVCCYLIYFGKLPFGDKANNIMQIYKEIIKGEIKIPKDCPLIVKELIEGLLKRNAAERINNFDKIKECQIFKDFDWDNLLRKKIKPFFLPLGDELGGKVNLNNLASPFEKFIQNEWVETSEMHLLKIKNKEINYNLEEFENEFANQEDQNYYDEENKVEFSNNWFDYF